MGKTLAIHEGSLVACSFKMGLSVHILIAILSFITALLSESSSILIGATSGGALQHDSPATSLLPRPDPSGRPQLMVAVYCGTTSSSSLYYNQYLDIDSRKWRSDRGDPLAVCTRDKQAILNYCKKVYPNHDISNIVESSRPYKLDNWCRLGASSKRHCHARLTVKPYRCLEGTFQSDALLVPERCVFDHVHNKSVCENPDHWNKSASDICHSKSMKLQSFGMLQPCGLDVFSGVEFVCCPDSSSRSKSGSGKTTADQPEGNSFAQAADGVLASLSKSQPKYEIDAGNEDASKKNTDEANEGSSGDENNGTGYDEDDSDDEYDEDSDDEDGYDDDSTSWNNGDKSSSTTSATITTTTTTTTTTERPIERYLSHFDIAHEHDDFRKAELAIQKAYQEKITNVMREWSQLDPRYEEMKREGELQAAEKFKRKMTHQFQKTLEALEQESLKERHQLASMHAERAMAIINRRKKTAMDCLTQALDRMPIRTRQVERCIIRLLKALEKDRSHTLRQYRNLLRFSTFDALKERKTILDHLVTLNRAANQSIAMLDRSPKLVERLKTKITALWHKLRGIPLDEPIVRESEEKIMDQYEEEAAKEKIERERKRLAEQESNQPDRSEPSTKTHVVSDSTRASNSGEKPMEAAQKNPHPAGAQIGQQSAPRESSPTTSISNNKPTEAVSTESTATVAPPMSFVDAVSELESASVIASQSKRASQNEIDTGKKERAHYQAEPAGFAHLRSEEAYHELSYSIRHEPLHGRMKFGYPLALVASFASLVLIAFVAIKYYGKTSRRAYRRQGFAEVGRTCPEEKSLSQMQFNGYENPAYKYFGAEA